MPGSVQNVHLFVLQHGLWGNKGHLEYITKQLEETYEDKIHALNAAVNEAKYTYDGIDICGKRLVEKIEHEVKELEKKGKVVNKVSLFGYSLGGLICRYAIGLLGESGFFDKHKPINFVTFATPHIGVYKPSNSVFSRLFNWLTTYILSHSGEQMRLVDKFRDGRPLLEIMASPDHEFLKHMARFERRLIYANAINDRSVPYWTAAFEGTNYFSDIKAMDIEYDENFKSVVKSFDLRDPSIKYTPPKKPFTWWSILKYVLFVFIPVLAPLWIIIGLSVVITQGLMSRVRVARMIRKQAAKITNGSDITKAPALAESKTISPTVSLGSMSDSSDQEGEFEPISKFVDENVLVPGLEGVNFPGSEVDHKKQQDDDSQSETDVVIDSKCASSHLVNLDKARSSCESSIVAPDSSTFNVQPGTKIAKSYKPLDLMPEQKAALKGLSTLSWQKVVLVLDSFNAHGSIVVRSNRFSSSDARAGIRHFVHAVNI